MKALIYFTKFYFEYFYLNNLKYEANLDVCDDYRTERQQIRKVQGSQHTFSYGDYVVKSLIGAIDPELDQADEKKSKKDCIIS